MESSLGFTIQLLPSITVHNSTLFNTENIEKNGWPTVSAQLELGAFSLQ